ncbi:MAG: MOSC domain-containing protein [Sphingomonadales bacterium]|nr:MOSC domain-containing protein [Sphingomonadales bacterium]MDE2567990.1 MOSC domain-containing protein [Sphingomonadales bacterium]
MTARVEAVARDEDHGFSKRVVNEIHLLEGLGVEGDAHMGQTVQHLSRMALDPELPNLRQVHLIQAELFEELAAKGFAIAPGALGENVTTGGIDLLALPRGARLRLGARAVVEVTGLRNPCRQIEAFRPGLLAETIEKRPDGSLLRKTGVMGVVLTGGAVAAGDPIGVELPEGPHLPLEVV